MKSYNIAVCLSGQIRTGIYAAPNIKRFIGDLWDNCDFFIHTWNVSNEDWIELKRIIRFIISLSDKPILKYRDDGKQIILNDQSYLWKPSELIENFEKN